MQSPTRAGIFKLREFCFKNSFNLSQFRIDVPNNPHSNPIELASPEFTLGGTVKDLNTMAHNDPSGLIGDVSLTDIDECYQLRFRRMSFVAVPYPFGVIQDPVQNDILLVRLEINIRPGPRADEFEKWAKCNTDEIKAIARWGKTFPTIGDWFNFTFRPQKYARRLCPTLPM